MGKSRGRRAREQAQKQAEDHDGADTATAIRVLDTILKEEQKVLLVARVSRCASLRLLHLGGCMLRENGADLLAAALPHCPRLEEVFLDRNGLCDEGAKSIARTLPNCPWLETLNLAGNRITNAGVSAVAVSLPVCRLRKLVLSFNQMDDVGLACLTSVLPSSALSHLHVSNNQLTAPCAAPLLLQAALTRPALLALVARDLPSDVLLDRALQRNNVIAALQIRVLVVLLAARRRRRRTLPPEVWEMLVCEFAGDQVLPT